MRIAKVNATTGAVIEVLQQTRLGEVLPEEDQVIFVLDSYKELRHVPDANILSDYAYDFTEKKWHMPEPDAPLEVVVEDKITEIKTELNNQLRQGFTTSFGVTLDCSTESLNIFTSTYVFMSAAGVTHLNVRDFYNVTHENVPMAQFIQMMLEMGGYVQYQYNKKWELSDTVLSIVENTPAPEVAKAQVRNIKW